MPLLRVRFSLRVCGRKEGKGKDGKEKEGVKKKRHFRWEVWLSPGFSEGGLETSNASTTWELARNADSQAPPGPAESETRGAGPAICLTNRLGDPDAAAVGEPPSTGTWAPARKLQQVARPQDRLHRRGEARGALRGDGEILERKK